MGETLYIVPDAVYSSTRHHNLNLTETKENRVTQLNQLIAIEGGAKAKTKNVMTNAYHTAQRAAGFAGISRTYTPKDDDGDRLPPESTLVQTKVDDLINVVTEQLTHLFDITASKDATNAVASADVTVNGRVIAEGLSVPTLLFLEKQLVDLRTFVGKLPTLATDEEWELDPNTGLQRTRPVETVKTKKIPKNWVKAPATDKHPAQVEIFHEDVNVGYWSTVKFSGALPTQRVLALLARIDELSDAVKFARETANQETVVDKNIGTAVLGYIFS